MLQNIDTLTFEDVLAAEANGAHPIPTRATSTAIGLVPMVVPLVAFVLGAWLASPQIGLAIFAFTYSQASAFSAHYRARGRKRYLASLLAARNLARVNDILLTRQFKTLGRHHRALTRLELVGSPAMALLLAIAQTVIVVVPAYKVPATAVVTFSIIGILGLVVHEHRHHTRLREAIRATQQHFPDPA